MCKYLFTFSLCDHTEGIWLDCANECIVYRDYDPTVDYYCPECIRDSHPAQQRDCLDAIFTSLSVSLI